MKNMSLALLNVALLNDKARVFGRIHLNKVVKEGTRFKTQVRLNESIFMTDVPVTKAELDDLSADNKELGMIELTKSTLSAFLKTLPEGTEIGANVSKKGHVYIKGIDSKDAIRLGEMPAPVKKAKLPSDDGFGGAPAQAAQG